VALLSILAACGGSGKHARTERVVVGPGFSFTAPAAWKVLRAERSVEASSGSALVSVTVFSLRKPYAPALFNRAAAELDRVAAKLAADSKGTLTESVTSTLAGRRARAYRYSTGSYDARVGFVLDGRHEYELFCRNTKADGACALLFSSFSLS